MRARLNQSLAWRLLPYLRPYRLRCAWALIQVFAIAGFELLKPWPLQIVIDNVLGHRPVGLVWLAGWQPLARGLYIVVAER